MVRTRLPLTATATLRATEPAGPYDVLRLRVDIRNDARRTRPACPGTRRCAAR